MDSDESVETIERRILSRLTAHDRSQPTSLLRTVILFIKDARGELLTEDEKNYVANPLFPHSKHLRKREVAETLHYRLKLIDRYEVKSAKLIEDILTLDYPTNEVKRLTKRRALILRELHEDPRIPKYKLAKKMGTTSRVITTELKRLQQEFAFQIITSTDPQKFRLISEAVIFRSKSIQHSERLKNYFQNQQGFTRTFQLDRDMRRGSIVFRYPDQPEGHRMFEEKVHWLRDKFFDEYYLIRLKGFYYSLSFSMYDPEINAFSFEPEIISEVLFSYIKQHRVTLPEMKGIDYSKPIRFDRADFLLAHSLYSTGVLAQADFKQNLLKQHGIEFTKKTIWKREQQLRKKEAAYPIIDMQIPGFDEHISFIVHCSPKACTTIRDFCSFLPYVIFFKTDSGCLFNIQRTAHNPTLTSQLLHSIHKEPDISDIKLLRYQWRSLSTPHIDIVRYWDEERQKWNIEEGAI
jgi:hypothetical protein